MAEWTVMLQDRPIKTFAIEEGGRVTIGRGSEADVVIDNTAISRVHAALELQSGVFFLSDLKSLNGTLVNGEKITDEIVPVAASDTIEIGKFRLVPTAVAGAGKSSSSARPMDLDDETVFVTNRSAAAPVARRTSRLVEKGSLRLVVLQGSGAPPELSLKGKSSVKIGKDSSCDLVVGGWFVASAQCYIIKRDEKFFVVPQRSWAATRLNDTAIKDEHQLRKGDIIQIRHTKIQFA